jgi:hypothetical protein
VNLVAQLARRARPGPVPLAVGAVFLAQIYFFQWHPGYPNPNEVIRIYLTRAIVEEGTFRVDGPVRRFGDVEDKAVFKGHIYCDKAPGLSFAAVVPFALARVFGDLDLRTTRHLCWLTVIVLPSVLLLLGLWRFLERLGLGEAERGVLLLAFGMGSLHYTFSTLLFSHAFASVLAMAAFLAVSSFRRGFAGPGRLAAGGLAAGFAVITEYPTVIPVFFTFLYLCLGPSWRRAWIFALAALPPLALLLWYNESVFGSPFATGYQHLSSAFFAGVHAKGLLGVTTPKAEAFLGSFFGTSRGVFYFAPWLALALPGFWLLLRRPGWRGEALVALGTLLVYGYFISSFGYWEGGGTVGQRHLTPLVPFLLVPIAEILRRLQQSDEVAWHALVRAPMAVGIVLTLGCTIPWPFVSAAYANPWPEISLPMWREYILPPSLLEAAGFSVSGSAFGFFVITGGVLAFIAAGPRRWPWSRRLVHGSVVTTLAALAVLGAEYLNVDAQSLSRHLRDRSGIARLVDPNGRRPALREERRLAERASQGVLTAEEARRLGFLLARRGDMEGALRWYREAAVSTGSRL